jgi:KDO2-lipid IV(A) lauroyltransferase
MPAAAAGASGAEAGATHRTPVTDGTRRSPRWLDYVEYAVFRSVVGVLGALPRRAALAVGAWIGEVLYVAARPQRRIALHNLALAFPERSQREHLAILRRSCRNLGRVAAEFCHLSSLSPDTIRQYVQVEDPACWQRALTAGAERGAVIVTGHFGNFELLAYAHGLLGHPITLVHRPMRNPLVDDAIIALRARAGTVSLPKKTAAKAALRALHDHRIVAIPADQNQTRRYGVFVDFFGLTAATTPGPARLAMLSRAPLLPVFLVRDGETDRHRIVVLPEIEMQRTGDREQDIIANTQRCTNVIEDMLRRYPDQWIWFHKRWKTRPLGDAKIY